MLVGAFQFDVLRGEIQSNLESATRGLEAAARAGLALVAFPELWPTSFPGSAAEAPGWVESSLRAVEELARRSAELGVVAVGSAFALSPVPNERPRNRMHLLSEGNDLLGFDKVHLFSPTGESLAFSSGHAAPRVASAAGMKVGGVVCYDLRFAEAIRCLSEAELIVVPAQWPDLRRSHWRALLRGRAVEAQAFVLGANRVGSEPLGRRRTLRFDGASILIAPDGEVLSELTGEEGLVAGELDLEAVAKLRSDVPVSRDRRDDLYGAWSHQELGG